MKRAFAVLFSYFVGGATLYLLSLNLQNGSFLQQWCWFLGLVGMAGPTLLFVILLVAIPHELGHIFVGRRLGFQFFGLRLMGLSWSKYLNRNHWNWDLMFLPDGDRMLVKKNPTLNEIRQLLIAGPLTSLFLAIFFLPLVFFDVTHQFGLFVVGANFVYALASILPSDQNYTDGTILLLSFKNPKRVLDITCRYYERTVQWLRPSGYNVGPVVETNNPNSGCYQNLMWYLKLMDSGKVAEAESFIKSALQIAQDNPKQETYIVETCFEAAVYFRRFVPNEGLALIADGLCQTLEPEHDKKRLVEGAILWTSGDKAEAIALWEQFHIDFSKQNPDVGTQVHGHDWFLRLRREDVIFETDRLFARHWTIDDVEIAFNIYRKPEVNKYLGRNPKSLETIEEAQEMLERWVANQAKRPAGQGTWALVRKEDETVIGTIMCKSLPNGDLEPSGEIEIGWHLDPSAWGYGYATEAGLAVAEYGFRMDPYLPRVLAVVYPENKPSQKVATNIGMNHLGVSSDYYGLPLELFELKRPQ